MRAWDKLKPDDELLKLMSQTLEKDMCSEQWRRGIIPHASTWLNSEPWNTERCQAVRDRLHADKP